MSELQSAERTIPAVKRKPLLSRVPAAFVRSVLKGHSSLGLAFAAAIYLVCLSGSLAVFAREFQRWENPLVPHVAEASAPAIQAAVAGAIAQAGDDIKHVFIYPAQRDRPWLLVMTDQHGTYRDWVADAHGRVTGEAPSPWTEFMTELHTRLHLPGSWGLFLVGLTGVALLSSLISGLLAHPRIFRDAFHLRMGGSRRLQEADLHNRMGVWALPFHLIVSTTGALLGLTTLIVGVLGMALFQGDVNKVYGLFIAAEPKDNPAPAPLLELPPMIAELQRIAPDGRITFIALEHPTEAGGAALFNVERQSTDIANVDSYAFDRDKLYYQARAAENNLGQRILQSISPLHYGWFGGGGIKIAYGLLGLAMTHLAASGVTIWLARRRDKGRAAPHWEQLWTAFVWSQPAALAAAALVGVTAPMVHAKTLLALWGVTTLIFLAAAGAQVAAARLSWIGRAMTAASLALAVLVQIAYRGGLAGDPVVWAVNGGLLLTAVCVAWSMRAGSPRPAPGAG